MAEKKSPKTVARSAVARTPAPRRPRAARPDPEAAQLEKIAAMPAPFQAAGRRLHALILRAAPSLQPSVWYGMPGYRKDGKTICFFRADKKFMTFGVTQDAHLAPEPGAPHQLIGSAWYFAALDAATEAALSAIVGRVAG